MDILTRLQVWWLQAQTARLQAKHHRLLEDNKALATQVDALFRQNQAAKAQMAKQNPNHRHS